MVVRAAGKIVRSWLGGMMVGGVGGDSVGSESVSQSVSLQGLWDPFLNSLQWEDWQEEY